MKKRNVVLATVFAIAAGVTVVAYKWSDWAPQSAVAQSTKAGTKKGGGPVVPVDVVVSVKKTMPVRVDLLDDISSDSPAVCGGIMNVFIDPWWNEREREAAPAGK